MKDKINWGIMSTAAIATDHVIPAMIQNCSHSVISAIASRNAQKAEKQPGKFGINNAYGSYDLLLKDKNIDAVYIPLPNHLHKEWMLKAMDAGKHVLCEKPLALSCSDIKEIIEARNRHNLKAAEAFMVNAHPQWIHAKEIVKSGKLGKIRSMSCDFFYYNADPENIRNIAEFGGGAILDIGCYPVHCSRFILDSNPESVSASIEFDTKTKTDTFASAVLDYNDVKCTFSVGTRSVKHQRFKIFGEKKYLEIEVPINAPNDRNCRINLYGDDILAKPEETISFDICDQYALQADNFSKAVINNSEVDVPLEDSLANTAVLKALFEANQQKKIVRPDYK